MDDATTYAPLPDEERVTIELAVGDLDALLLILLEYVPDTDDEEDAALRRRVADNLGEYLSTYQLPAGN
jgi:hypothetical protein